jgi:hypothetical protein
LGDVVRDTGKDDAGESGHGLKGIKLSGSFVTWQGVGRGGRPPL